MEQRRKKKKNYLLAFWRVVYPAAMYLIITIIVQIPFIAIVMLQATKEAGKDAELMQTLFNEKLMLITLPSMLAAILITIPILLFLMKKDKQKKDAEFGKTTYSKTTTLQWILIAIMAIAYCIGGNNLIIMSKISELFPGFEAIAESLYSGSVIMQILVVAIAAPIVEEFIFRGLVHNRIKEYSNPIAAGILSALIFGIYHMNMVQAIYAFGLGLAMSYVYEKFHTVGAPVLFHVVANFTSVMAVETGFLEKILEPEISIVAIVLTIICAVAVVCITILFNGVKQKETIEKKEEKEDFVIEILS